MIWSREKVESKSNGTNFYTPEQHIDISLLKVMDQIYEPRSFGKRGTIMKRIILSIIVSSMVMLCSVHSFAQQKDEPAKKVYLIYVNNFRSSSYVLEGIESSDFNGVKCLKGTHVDLTWVANRTIYIPVDKIEEIIEYDSISQYKEDIDKYNKKKLENG
jgi:hypothetical protein